MQIDEIATRQQLESLQHDISKISEQLNQLAQQIGNVGSTKPTLPLYNKTEAAKFLGMSISTILRKIKNGEIRTNATGQVPAEELERYCSRQKPIQSTKGVPPAFLNYNS